MPFSRIYQLAIQKVGDQNNLATHLDRSPSEITRKINGTIGWQEAEIDKMLELTGLKITDCSEYQAEIDKLKDDIATLKKTIRILSE